MPFFPKSKQDLVSSMLNKLDENTNITQMTPGGKARFFVETASTEQAAQQALFDANLLQPYIQYANGKFLDFFGDMLSLPRIEATHASTSDENFMFYVQTGNFGDLNNGSSFSIPAGSIVTTTPFQGQIVTPGLESQPVISYTTTAEVVCLPDSSFVYAPTRASQEGKSSSVPRNVLNNHSIGGYLLSNNGSLKCTNRFAIDNGDERESDTSYRYRLVRVFRSREQAVRSSIRLAALSVPGVSDVLMINYEQGPATYSVYLKGLTPTVSPDLLETVSAEIALVSSEGVRPFVLAPRNTGMDFVAVVNWHPKVSAEEKTLEYATMRNAVEDFLNSLDIGQPVDLIDIIDVMTKSAPHAISLGRAKPNSFEEVYLYRASPDGNGSVRSRLLNDTVSPLYNERVILETSTSYRGIQFI